MRRPPKLLNLAWLGLLVFVALAVTKPAHADRAILWRLTTDQGESGKAEFARLIQLTLAQAEGTHLVSDRALSSHLRDNALQLPECFEGLKPCVNSSGLLIEALDVDGLVEANLTLNANGDYSLELRYSRSHGGSAKELWMEDPDLEHLVREAVGSLFTLEAQLVIVSDPPESKLFVNGNYVGDTPVTLSIGEGLHALRLQKEGYEMLRSEVALTPGEQRRVELTMTPELTQVTVLTAAPGAEVWIDDALSGMAGEPVDVMPGNHRVELRAAGYHPIAITFDIDAAERRTLALAMLREVEDPWVIRQRNVERYRMHVQAAYALNFQSVSFADASVKYINDESFTPANFGGASDTSLVLNGAAISGGMTWGMFGLDFLEIVLLGSTSVGPVTLINSAGQTLDTTGGTVTHFSIKPIQGTFRYLYGPFAVEATTGFGISYDGLTLNHEGNELRLGLTHGLWSLSAAGRYFWAEQWFFELGYMLEVDFSGERGPRHGLFAGVGFNLPFAMRDDGGSSGEEAPDVLPEDEEEIDNADALDALINEADRSIDGDGPQPQNPEEDTP